MTVSYFRKKPIVVAAIQWTTKNIKEILLFTDNKAVSLKYPRFPFEEDKVQLVIHTLEGDMVCPPNGYVIRGVTGEYYPCQEDIFNATYEKVEEKQS